MRYCLFIPLLICCLRVAAQKQVNDQQQVWVSVNSTMRLSDRWGSIADVHVRRNNYLADPSFYFVRGGASYWVTDNLSLVAGYAHMWLAPTREGWSTFADENRLYEQVIYSSAIGKVGILNRFRNEHRWREVIENDQSTGKFAFSDRLRYLISIGVPLSSKPRVPQLSFANEVLIQFGKSIVYNTFDQVRLFGGIRQNIGKGWSYDCGYMLVFQQNAGGQSYNRNHTIRLFFYYTLDKRRKKPAVENAPLMFEDE
ncbi:DUF2490 domain-containing protein [Chitinophaga barathri]|uniref:DUF2490 domain-containing protein n=1 Tax=Chitinophaga barathri TaxID=1647451 RepID=A0A3N4M900_9BACT|nr:DUF2490 domain-containing protein [Chitinophaga barathri]RPD39765.1 DUF2490 domain-containing protein [Chitinophaga barathri]